MGIDSNVYGKKFRTIMHKTSVAWKYQESANPYSYII